MNKKTRAKVRRALLSLSMVLVMMLVAVGGTIAWLTDKTAPVVNTFSPSEIDITLTETTGSNYKMVPGVEVDKDPKVTVNANSEAAWVFVKIEEANAFDTYFADYEKKVTDAGWTKLEEGVFYRQVAASGSDQEFKVFNDDKLLVLSTVTNQMMSAAETAKPTLTFTAYAIQQEKFATAQAAWTEVSANGTTWAPVN